MVKDTTERRELPHVFVSYARENANLLNYIVRELTPALGGKIDIFYDDKVLPGERWREILSDKIQGACVFLVLLTPQFLDRPFCVSEVERALACTPRLKVIPVVLEECNWTHELPSLAELHAFEIRNDVNRLQRIKDLGSRILSIVGTDRHPTDQDQTVTDDTLEELDANAARDTTPFCTVVPALQFGQLSTIDKAILWSLFHHAELTTIELMRTIPLDSITANERLEILQGSGFLTRDGQGKMSLEENIRKCLGQDQSKSMSV